MKRAAPIITVDLEEWFHLLEVDDVARSGPWSRFESRIEANTDRILELLHRHGVRATFFSLGWIASRHAGLLRRIAAAGHHIGCHSYVHSLVHQQTPEAFQAETRQALDAISSAVSTSVDCYRAPGFSITASSPWAFEILHQLGVRIDCSVYPGRHAHGGTGDRFPATPFRIVFSGGSLKEFPMSVRSLGPVRAALAGGGYFRLLPLALMSTWTRHSPYVMTYFHPRDFDPNQPRLLGLPLRRRFKSYIGLGSSLGKLDRYLALFGGRSVAEAERDMEWGAVPVVSI